MVDGPGTVDGTQLCSHHMRWRVPQVLQRALDLDVDDQSDAEYSPQVCYIGVVSKDFSFGPIVLVLVDRQNRGANVLAVWLSTDLMTCVETNHSVHNAENQVRNAF